MNDDDIQQIFFVECEEALEATETGLDACKAGTHDDETINAIFRGVHSIKGGAGAFGHTALASYTHCFENLLGDIREDKVELTTQLTDLLLLACDLLRDHVEAARGAGDLPDDADLMQRLEAARDGQAGSGEDSDGDDVVSPAAPDAATAPVSSGDDLDLDLDALLDDLTGDASAEPEPQSEDEAPSWLVHLRPHAGAMENGGEPLLWLRELVSLGGTCEACGQGDVPVLDALDTDQGYLVWTFRMPGSVAREDVADIFDFVDEDCGLAYDDDPLPPLKLKSDTPAEHVASGEEPAKAEPETAPVQDKPADTGSGGTDGDKSASKPAPSTATVSSEAETAKTPSSPPAKTEPEAKPKTPDAKTPEAKTPDAKPQPAASSTPVTQSVRIDLAKLDRLIDGVGELVIAQAMVAQRLENENFAHIEELGLLDTLIRDIQEHAMAFRAQPISSVFGRVPRLLRELGSNTGKHVKLEVHGESTELDKTVIERLSEPMTHLIRNAVDHGIEGPEDRKAAGKDPEGTLTLSAEQKAGRVVIHIKDDGRGINREKVLSKAIENGIVAQDANLTDDEVCQLIFAPGFSTAASVTSVSGRGVGMDVVKSNVRDLGGRITIESVEGEGTTFSLALPLTLAISDGMIVQAGDLSLVVPLTHVIESLRPNPEDLKGVGTKRTMLNVRGRFVPVVSLGAITGAKGWIDDPCKGVVVLVETEGHGQAALMVDLITDQRQFVIKSLDANFRSVDGVAGATILGNGQVSLIVDVDHMVRSAVAPASLAIAA